MQIYNETNHMLIQSQFATNILGIKVSMFQKLKKGEIFDVKIFQNEEEKETEKETVSQNLRVAKERISDIKDIFINGGNIEDICKLLFISNKTCSTILMRLEEEGLLDIEECENDRIINLYRKGFTAKQIEKSTNFDIQRIRSIVKEEKTEIKRELKNCGKRVEMASKLNKIFDDLKYTKKEFNLARDYIALCKDTMNINKFTDFELGVLKDSIAFVKGGLEEVCIYIKICILERRYDSAIRMINISSSNDNITDLERMKLYEMRKKIEYVSNLQRAFDKSDGITDYDRLNKIAQEFEIRVIDLLRLKKLIIRKIKINYLIS